MSDSSAFHLWWKMPGDAIEDIKTFVPNPHGTTTFHFSPFDKAQGNPALRVRGNALPVSFPLNAELSLESSPEVPDIKKEDHLSAVNSALADINGGELKKVVISRSEFWSTLLTPEELFRSKCEMYPDAMVYLLAHPDVGVWLGASPELLLQRIGDEFETVSLAGTKSSLTEPWTDKERREQEMVTDFITHRLRVTGAQGVAQRRARDRTYGTIKHLESKIVFSSDQNDDALLEELHPTPAVGGEPRDHALRFIAKHEKQNRAYYTGFLGWSQEAEANYFVNLRCMQCFSNGFRLFAGGGIVKGSDALAEWEETRAKIETIRTNLKR